MPIAEDGEVLLTLRVSQSIRARQCPVGQEVGQKRTTCTAGRSRDDEKTRVGRSGTSSSAIGWLYRTGVQVRTTAVGKTVAPQCVAAKHRKRQNKHALVVL
jgi:hypothetical protein